MGQSLRVRLQDLQAIHRIVGECRELGDDPSVWRHRLCQGFRDLAGAAVVFPGELCGFLCGPLRKGGDTAWTEGNIDFGPLWEAYDHNIRGVARRSDLFQGIKRAVRREGPGSFTRRRLLPDDVWYRSWESDLYRSLIGLSDHLCTALPISGGTDRYSAIHMHRAKGSRPFGERDRVLVQRLHEAVVPLIGGPLASYADPAPSELPLRARQVLRLLLEGEGDKQVAKALGISPHTVNQYTKVIFAHFRVGSRAELLARWVRRGWSSRAAWSTAPDGGRVFRP